MKTFQCFIRDLAQQGPSQSLPFRLLQRPKLLRSRSHRQIHERREAPRQKALTKIFLILFNIQPSKYSEPGRGRRTHRGSLASWVLEQPPLRGAGSRPWHRSSTARGLHASASLCLHFTIFSTKVAAGLAAVQPLPASTERSLKVYSITTQMLREIHLNANVMALIAFIITDSFVQTGSFLSHTHHCTSTWVLSCSRNNKLFWGQPQTGRTRSARSYTFPSPRLRLH